MGVGYLQPQSISAEYRSFQQRILSISIRSNIAIFLVIVLANSLWFLTDFWDTVFQNVILILIVAVGWWCLRLSDEGHTQKAVSIYFATGLVGIALITASIGEQFIPIIVLGMFIFVSLTAFLDVPGSALRWVAAAIILYGLVLAVRVFTPIWHLTAEPLYLVAYFLFPAIGLVAIGLFGQHIATRLNQTMVNSEMAQAELADRNRALSQAQEELTAHYAHLEQSVQERTSELIVAHQEWENIFQAIGHPAVILDPQHRVIAANRAVVEATGLPMKELIGQTCYAVFHTGDSIPQTCPMEKMLLSENFETETMEMEAFNGTFLVSCTPVLDEQGHLLKTIHIATDITGQKKAEEALRRHADKLEALGHASLAIGGRLELGGLLKSVVEQSVELFEGVWGAIYLSYHDEHGVFGMQIPLDSSLRPNKTVLKYIEELAADTWKAGKPIIVNAPQHWKTSTGAAGHDSRHPWGSFMSTLVRWGKDSLGVILVAAEEPDKFLATDVRLLSLFAGQAAIAITNAHTFETGQDTQKQLHALASYLQVAREKERTHIAREIHDEFGQAMTALKMDVSWLKRHLPADDANIIEKTDDMSNLIDSTIQTVRRVATELRPGLLDDLGLAAAIEWQVNEFSERAGCHCETYVGDHEIALDRDRATAVFRILQEALTNIARHARATQVWVTMESGHDALTLMVKDNGQGCSEERLVGPDSLGLLGMRERARAWDGDVMFESAPGQGMVVKVRMPQTNTRGN